ncbi:transglycosylase SLT domain-containing protein [Nocardia spumae]|uniref:transglycosylase SLT domain-containing protein n=1 Tax=Nocardia spumae TaxID=2887190 RepID=UPI001D141A9E|nr:transglycosylase SLT domain-containing protein [Nocardia spumae]
MPDFSAGSASIKITPSFKTFVREARAELRAMDLSAEVKLQPQTGVAKAAIEKFRKEQSNNPLDVRVNANTAPADGQLSAWRAKQEANALGLKVDIDRASSGAARNGLSKLKDELSGAAKINLSVVGVLGAGAAVADLLAIADAAAQAAHMLALLPAAGLGGLAGVGSAAVGFKGIPDAFKALSQASDSSAQNAIQQRDALNAVSEAQYKVGQSQRAVGQAGRQLKQDQIALTDAYKDANRSIRDMNISLDEQKLNVSDAGIAVREAAKNLQKVQFDPTADSDARQAAVNDYQRAILSYQQAQNKANDLASDTADANAKGVEGSKQVVDAKQRVIDDTAAEADAVHNLQQAYYDLSKAQAEQSAGGAQGKINEAFSKLSPNAQQAVNDIHSLGPAWTDARRAAQDALTDGMGPAIVHLANVQLPTLKSGMVDINHALNEGISNTLDQLSTQTSRLQFSTFLGNTATAFRDLAGAARPATAAIETLATVGSFQMPQLAVGIENASLKFDALIQKAAADGSLEKWIHDGITSGKELADIIGHLGSSMASVFRAAGDNGQTLKSLDDMTARMAAFLKSAQGQTDLGQIFDRMREEGDKLAPILHDLPALLAGVADGFRLWGDITLPFLREASSLLAAHPHLVELAVAAYLGFKTVGPLVDGAKLAIDGLAKKAGEAGEGTKGVGKLKAAGEGLLGVLGNPWTLGLAVAGATVIGFMNSTDKAAESMKRLQDQTSAAIDADRNLQKVLLSSHGNATESAVLDAETQSVKGLRDAWAANAADMPGIGDKIQEGATTIANSLFGIGGGVLQNDKTRDDTSRLGQAAKSALDSIGLANDQLAGKITGSKPEFDALVDRLSDMGDGGREAASKLSQLRDEWALDAATVSPVVKAIQDLSDKNKDAATSIDAATSAMERQRQGNLTFEDAQLRANQALSAMGSSAQQASNAIIEADGSIDTTTSNGQQLYQLLNQQLAPAWEQVTSAAYRDAIQHGQTAEQAKAAAQKQSDAMHDSALKSIEAMGYTQAQADALLKHYEPLAGNFNGTFTVDTSQAMTALGAYQKMLDDVKNREGQIPAWMQLLTPGITGGQNIPSLSSPANPNATQGPGWYQYLQAPGHATGGLLTGPGSGTSDSMLARVSNGEFINREASVRKYGVGFFEALNSGRIDPKSLPGFADGGVVDPNDPTKPQIPGMSSQTVTYPQAQLPTPMTDQQIQVLQGQSAVDAANSERNRVYADPNSTPQDKRASDLKYLQVQNQLKSAQEQTGSGALPKQYTVPGIASRFAGVLAQGVLDSVGLGSSALSDSSVYAGDFQKVGDYLQKQGAGTGAPGYNYTPQNLPSTLTTYTPLAVPQGTAVSPYAGATPGGVGGQSAPSSYNPEAGVEQWRGLSTQVLIREGFNPAQVDIMLAQIQSESGGNPSIVQQVKDVNSGGNEAVGLLQVIPGTFATYRDPSLPNDRTNPEANMVAALRYYRAAYGSDLSTMWGQGHGYADGGLIGGIGGGRSDTQRIWASAGEFIVNSYDAQRNLPLLQAINSSQWNPVSMPALAPAFSGAGAASVNRDHSVNFYGDTHVMNHDDLVRGMDRYVEQQSMGALAAYS